MTLPRLTLITDALKREHATPQTYTEADAQALTSALGALENAAYALRVHLMCEHNLGAIAEIRNALFPTN